MRHLTVRTRAVLVLVLVAGLLGGLPRLPGLVAQSDSAAPPAAAAAHWAPSRDFDVRHYKIDVTLDWSTKTVAGRTTVTARPFRDGTASLVLDADDMTVTAVTDARGGPLHYTLADARLTIALGRPYRASEEVSVTVAHHGSPLQGLRFVDGATVETGRSGR